MRAQRLTFHCDCVVSRQRESGHTSDRPLLNVQASKKEQQGVVLKWSLSHLPRYHEKDYGFLSQMATGDETWGYHLKPVSKRQSKQWKRLLCLTHIEFLECGTSVIQRYRATLQYLR
ncbi:hypothetical protein TNCV_2008851 [Trichonephila clavipes]|nr:hypothetical protein TNCV_2008851 [Trichonephila clavipes]